MIEDSDGRIKNVFLALGLRPDMAAFGTLINHNRNTYADAHVSVDDENDKRDFSHEDATTYRSPTHNATMVYDRGMLSCEEGNELRALFRSYGSLIMESSFTREHIS